MLLRTLRLFLPLYMLIIGCNCRAPKVTSVQEEDDKTMISPAEARAALVTLVENTDDELLQNSLPHVRKDMASYLDASTLEIGPFRCNVRTLQFQASFSNSLMRVVYDGRFGRTESGQWSAAIENVSEVTRGRE
jgi:hypothetical protein